MEVENGENVTLASESARLATTAELTTELTELEADKELLIFLIHSCRTGSCSCSRPCWLWL